MAEIHEWFAWVVIGANAIVGIWATAAHRFAVVRHRSLWWAAGVAHTTVAVQIIFGVYLVTSSAREADDFHMFYGFLALVAIAVIVSYRHLSAYRYLIYGLGSLFVMGLAIRAALLEPLTL